MVVWVPHKQDEDFNPYSLDGLPGGFRDHMTQIDEHFQKLFTTEVSVKRYVISYGLDWKSPGFTWLLWLTVFLILPACFLEKLGGRLPWSSDAVKCEERSQSGLSRSEQPS